MRRLSELLKAAESGGFNMEEVFEQARALSFERFDCPLCKSVFMSKMECIEHLDIEHPMARMERPLFCEVKPVLHEWCNVDILTHLKNIFLKQIILLSF